MDRRRFLHACGCAGLGLTTGAGAVWALRPPPEQPVPTLLGTLEGLPEGGVHLDHEHQVALVRAPRGLVLLSTRCTHLGCPLRLTGRRLTCPCHGGQFDLTGAVRRGPPRSPLPWLEGEVGRLGQIYVYLNRFNRGRAPIPL